MSDLWRRSYIMAFAEEASMCVICVMQKCQESVSSAHVLEKRRRYGHARMPIKSVLQGVK